MKAKLIVNVLQKIYPIIRPVLMKAVDDPNVEWDNMLMDIVDRIFAYDFNEILIDR